MSSGRSGWRRFDAAHTGVGPYVPSLTADWLRDCPQERYRALDGTLVFADISGFTRLTGMLARSGRIGSEELAELINATFESLLSAAYAFGAGLIKYGGDATLLWFEGHDHVARACRAAWEMQAVMAKIGRLQTSRGSLRLRMSVGIHSGAIDFLLVGSRHRELIITGPGVSTLTRMEKLADAGQIVISAATAAELDLALSAPLAELDDALLLRGAPTADPIPAPLLSVDYEGIPIERSLSAALRQHVLAERVDHEHRTVTTGFVKFSGADELLAEHGPAALTGAIEDLIIAAQRAAELGGVTFLPSDIYAGGGKLLLIAGAPRQLGADQDRMIATLRRILDHQSALTLRAGISVGETFVGDYGPPYRRTYSLLGDSVNLAARLMEHAAPGELLAAPEVLKGATGSFPAVLCPPFMVKGKKDPVLALSIGTPTMSAGSGPPLGPLLGRADELGRLLGAVPVADGSGSVVEVVGPPGIGKSRLLGELRSRAGVDVLWTDGDVYRSAVPYAPFERLLRSRSELSDQLPPEAAGGPARGDRRGAGAAPAAVAAADRRRRRALVAAHSRGRDDRAERPQGAARAADQRAARGDPRQADGARLQRHAPDGRRVA